jgi:porphobilinogen synthase
MRMIFEFPRSRARRLRASRLIRDLVAETRVSVRNLVMPVFVKEGGSSPEEIPSMPGQFRLPLPQVVAFTRELADLGIRSILLFGIPKNKDPEGSEAYSREGVVQKALREIRRSVGDDILVFTDVCMCQYTDHGHCGVLGEGFRELVVDNDKTLEYLGRIAVSHAEAGADFVAPSGMIDGMVKAIRDALDEAGYQYVGIMSYSVKYASGMYGPFRSAAYSAPRFGSRRGYQMDPRNSREAVKEAIADVVEGADIIMVKPALAYLDVIRAVREELPVPIAAYSVSGEYSMIKAAAERGWLDEKTVVLETLHSIVRAGADIVVTYYASEIARWARGGLIDLEI